MTPRKPAKSSPSLAELFDWIDDFHARSEHFDDATPPKVWDLLLRALGLKTVLHGDTSNPEFRKLAIPNLRRFVRDLKDWESKAKALTNTRGREA